MQILNNAIDALSEKWPPSAAPGQKPEDGKPPKITIRTEVTASACGEGSRTDWVKIRIADNGPGISELVQKQIFDPFFTTKPVGSGTGLGLSTSYSIVVNKHGGELHCISPPGQGAEFVIEIPIQPKAYG